MITKSKLFNVDLTELIMDSMPGLLFFYEKNGKIAAWNKRACEVLEYSEDEMKEAYAGNFSDEKYKNTVRAAFEQSFITGFAQVEHLLVTKSGRKIPFLTKGRTVSIDGEEYLIGLAIDISELYSAREKITEQLKDIAKLNEQLQAENIYLKDRLESTSENHKIIGESQAIKYTLFKIKQVASTGVSVLIQGETGTGKELIARAIHEDSERKDKQFVKVNCASIPENLIESELFGHEKGAFTGAVENRIGRFELANGGTIFLDEIGELPMNLQPKLLHVLQQGEFERIGSSKTIKTNVRVIAATNKVLDDEIKMGRFRIDLYYRLNVFPITVTPLRERKADITPLVKHYIKFYSEKLNKKISVIPKATLKKLIEYTWPGNVRELENVIERAIITSQNNILNVDSLPKSKDQSIENFSLEEIEINYIKKALEKTYGKISGPGGAADILKINPQTLRSKMRKLGIKRIS